MLPNKIMLRYRIWNTVTAKKRIIYHFKNTFIILHQSIRDHRDQAKRSNWSCGVRKKIILQHLHA